MRLLYICNEYPPAPHGGIGTFVQTLARALVEKGHDVWVVGYDDGVSDVVEENDQGVQVVRLPLTDWPVLRIGRFSLSPRVFFSRWRLSRYVNDMVEAKKIDLVESYDWSGPLWFAPNCPLLLRLHGANAAHAYFQGKRTSLLLSHFEKRNIALANNLVAVSEHVRQITLDAFNMQDKSCGVIYNGIDTHLFSPSEQLPEPERVLYVGRIHPNKGIHELFRAWERVNRKHPNAKLVLAGNKPSDMNPYMSGLSFDLNSIEFMGFVPHTELPNLYRSASVCVFPSRAEAFGLTCAEAMACGCAVIMTALASGPELVTNGESGILIEPTDAEGFAKAISSLLSDTELRRRLGANAVQRARQLFNKDVLIEENIKLYESTIQTVNSR